MRKFRAATPAFFVLISFLFAPAVCAQQQRFAELERVVQEEMSRSKTPGAVVTIVENGKVVYDRAFGVANAESAQPVTSEMLFRIGSMTKMYTAATLLSLAEEGKLDLNAPIGKYLEGLSPRLSLVTAHQLMTHSAGFSDRANLLGARHDDGALAEWLKDINDSIFFTEPAQVFSYANPGWVLAGLLIEKLTGEPYRLAVEKRVLRPLGMVRSTFLPTVAMTYPLAVGHGGEPEKPAVVARPMEDNAREWPEGFLFSNTAELARFATAFMNNGRIDGKQVLAESVVKKMSTPYVPVPSQADGAAYGYGLIMMKQLGVPVIEHGGTMLGFASDFVMVPSRQLAVIVLVNRRTHMMGTVDKALELMLPNARKAPVPAALETAPTEADEYIGTYAQTTAKVDIVRTETGIAMRQGTVSYPLRKIGKDVFLGEMPGFTEPLRFCFVRGTDGKIAFFHARLRAWKRQL